MKLLYLEHNPKDQLHLIRLTNALPDCEVKLAMDFDQASRVMVEHQFDMVLAGTELPGGSISAIEELVKSTPLIVLENLNGSGDLKTSLPQLYKPLSSDDLQKLISDYGQNERAAELIVSQDDFAYIEKLTKGKTTLKLDLMQIFLDVVGEETKLLQVALPKKDWLQISGSLHKMKSNLRMFGWTEVVDCLDSAEKQARDQVELKACESALPTIIAGLMEKLDLVRQEIDRLNNLKN